MNANIASKPTSFRAYLTIRMNNRIGIIGAGIAGAWLANQLSQQGNWVTVFEKSRGLGGRLATRRLDDITFDHGAQFFTARTQEFQNLLDIHREHIADWQPKVMTIGDLPKPFKRNWFEPHYIGVPGMGAVCRQLLSDVQVELGFEVQALYQTNTGWLLVTEDGKREEVDWVISTAPAEQTQKLIPSAPLEDVAYSPCFALMVYLETPPSFDAAVIRGGPLEWLAVTASRHARPTTSGIVAHATPEWSQDHFDEDRDTVSESLLTVLGDLKVQVRSVAALHRWRYARVVTTHREPFWLDEENQLAACGDWGVGANVEDAFTSANLLLEQLASNDARSD